MSNPPTPGTPLPVERQIVGPDGQPVLLRDLLGEEGLFLAFVKTECPTCTLMAPYLDRIATHHGATPLPVVIVSQNTAAELAAFATEHSLAFPCHTENAPYETAEAFGIRTAPTCLRMDETGVLIRIQEGFSKAFLEDLDGELSSITGQTPADVFEDQDVPALRPG